MAAVKAAGVDSALKPDTAWTILAPTNDAFTSRLQSALGITSQQLLKEANSETLVKVLSYHVIPSGAVLSSQLLNGQQVITALAGTAPLTVVLKDGTVTFLGAGSNATVLVADIKAGQSVVHVANDVLVPAGVGNAGSTAAPTSG